MPLYTQAGDEPASVAFQVLASISHYPYRDILRDSLGLYPQKTSLNSIIVYIRLKLLMDPKVPLLTAEQCEGAEAELAVHHTILPHQLSYPFLPLFLTPPESALFVTKFSRGKDAYSENHFRHADI